MKTEKPKNILFETTKFEKDGLRINRILCKDGGIHCQISLGTSDVVLSSFTIRNQEGSWVCAVSRIPFKIKKYKQLRFFLNAEQKLLKNARKHLGTLRRIAKGQMRQYLEDSLKEGIKEYQKQIGKVEKPAPTKTEKPKLSIADIEIDWTKL